MVSCTTAKLDAAELLDVGRWRQTNYGLKGKTGRLQAGSALDHAKAFYWKNSPMEDATADAPGISLTFSSCSMV
jgi:hypothetical protein